MITIYTILLSIIANAQNKKNIKGYYKLSEFEMSAQLVLLENGQFYYSAIFGSVDLYIFGTYTIENKNIIFQSTEEETQPFGLYGRENKTLTNEIEFFYYKPDEDHRFNVLFSLDDDWIKNTKEQEPQNEVYFKIKHKRLKTLKIAYPALFNKNENYFKIVQTNKASVPSKNNSFILTFNRYYAMRKQFINNPMVLDGENIVKGEKIIKRQEIPKGEEKKISSFINNHKLFKDTIEVKGKIYKKITQTVESSSPILKLTANGLLKKIKPNNKIKDWKNINNKFYTIDYPSNWINDFFKEKNLKFNMISSPEKISGVEIIITEGNLTDLENIIKEVRDKNKENMPNIILKKKSIHNLKYELKLKDKTKEGKLLARYYLKNNNIIKIIAHNTPKHKSIIAKILKSFKPN